jgi:prepilin-type N-terminal cleavage/methylation domain-containing protein
MWVKHKQLGFTIVELLIVIVVIGILAAITIVAYNGIQTRARVSAASSALSQAAKKIAVWQVDNPNTTPTDLATVGVVDSSDVSYQYKPGVNGAYCITATAVTVSYKITESSQPTSGACAGHSSGGVAAITNLVLEPSVETSRTFWSVGSWGTSGAGTLSYPGSSGYHGSSHLRMTWSAANTTGEPYVVIRINGLSNPVGKTYTCSAYVRTSWTAQVQARLVFSDSSAAWISSIPSGTLSQSNSTWSRRTVSGTAPVNSANALCIYVINPSTPAAVGSTYDVDAAMFTEGSTIPNYADGSSSGWDWAGTANSSASTGPPL